MDTNACPPLRFHSVHGRHIVLQKDERLARRTTGSCQGVTFSNRPIFINEKVHIQVVEVSRSRREGLKFGVTNVDPERFRRCPPVQLSASMNGPEFSVRDLPTICLSERAVTQIFANQFGCIFYKVLGEFGVILGRGCLFRYVDVSRPIWMIFDIYGNTVALQFIDRPPTVPRPPLPRPIASPTIALEAPTTRVTSSTTSSTRAVTSSNTGLPSQIGMSRRDSAQLTERTSQQYRLTENDRAPTGTGPRSPSRIAPPSSALDAPTTRHRSSSATSTRAVTSSSAGLVSRTGMERRESAALSERTSQQNQLTENDRAPARTGPRSPLTRPIAPPSFASDAPTTRHRSSSATSTRAVTFSSAGLVSQIGVERRGSAPLSERTSQQNQLTENEPSRILFRTGSRSTPPRCTPIRTARHSSVPPAVERSTPCASIRRSPGSLHNFEDYDVDVCKVCYDAQVDTALYKCGHVCMCEDCAKETLNIRPFCPICRDVIRDIIKIFRV